MDLDYLNSRKFEMRHMLSKSRILEFIQCPKRLYLTVHHPDLAQEPSGQKEKVEIGEQIGGIARSLFPDGIMIPNENNELDLAVSRTRYAIQNEADTPLFEATFEHQGLLVQIDILAPEANGYRMIEVKSSTDVKEHHLQDAAIQVWVMKHAGIRLSGVSIMHVDKEFQLDGEGNYAALLKEVDVNDSILELVDQVPMWIEDCHHILQSGIPGIEIGRHCDSPFECPFKKFCSAGQPEFPVHLLPNTAGKNAANKLKAQGYVDLREVPAGILQHETLERIRRVTASGAAELDPAASQAINELEYPRYYLDFETIQFAIPIWTGTRPYQQLPFQWSCHIETGPDQLEHREFLDVTGDAPMRDFAESLLRTLGNDGPILVYNQAFEKTRIKELAAMFPDLSTPLLSLLERVVDLLPITKDFYYHPAMKGSWSIKAVLPTIAPDLCYADLDGVQDGNQAQQAFAEAIDQQTPADRREALRNALRSYCQLDTLAMVRLTHFLAKGETQ